MPFWPLLLSVTEGRSLECTSSQSLASLSRWLSIWMQWKNPFFLTLCVCVCVCVCLSEWETERVCVWSGCVWVRERESECVCVRARESVRVCVRACLCCFSVWQNPVPFLCLCYSMGCLHSLYNAKQHGFHSQEWLKFKRRPSSNTSEGEHKIKYPRQARTAVPILSM